MHRRNRRLRLAALLATSAWVGGASGAWAAGPSVTLNPTENHPNSNVQVSGAGFGAYESVDIYFDTTDEALAITNSAGQFSKIPVPVSASALPGTHYVTAVERHTDEGAQAIFTVNTDWAEFHFDHKLKGLNPWENVLTPNNVSSLDEAWTGTTGSYVESAPSVVGGVVYVGSDDGYLYTFNAATGAPGWFFHIGSEVTSSPAVANGIVYAANSSDSLVAINATSGQLVWSATLGGSAFYQAPVVSNGIVYIGCQDNNLYAFNASTGALLWKVGPIGTIDGSPAVSNGVIYIGSADGDLIAVNATTGALLWQDQTDDQFFYSPAVANGTVYVEGEDNGLYAFAADSGAEIWNSPCTAGGGDYQCINAPAVANGVVYISGSEGVYAFSAGSGARLWYTVIGKSDAQSAPAVANGVVYVGSCTNAPDAGLYALNPATGAVLWSATTGGECIDSSPAVSNGMVYVGSFDNNLHAYALNGGNDRVYRQKRKPPAISSLHPNWSLKPAN